jgi:hypothetical protein
MDGFSTSFIALKVAEEEEVAAVYILRWPSSQVRWLRMYLPFVINFSHRKNYQAVIWEQRTNKEGANLRLWANSSRSSINALAGQLTGHDCLREKEKESGWRKDWAQGMKLFIAGVLQDCGEKRFGFWYSIGRGQGAGIDSNGEIGGRVWLDSGNLSADSSFDSPFIVEGQLVRAQLRGWWLKCCLRTAIGIQREHLGSTF